MLTEVAEAWIASYATTSALTPGERSRAKDRVVELVAERPRDAVEFVRLVLDRSRDAWVLENLGAGPVEDLLHCVPREMLAVLSAHPSRDAVLTTISHVWTAELPAAVVEELGLIVQDQW